MSRNTNTFGVFLERMQQNNARRPQAAVRSAVPVAESDATKAILNSLQEDDVVDPASLGVGFVELGRALDRLQSLGGIVLTTQHGRQVIQRGEKYDDVCSLISLR